jgi:hypothetical protein
MNALFLWVVTRGWAVGLGNKRERGRRLRLLMIAGSLPLSAAVAYWPWPVFTSFYALPYFLSSAIILAMALTFLETRAPRQALIAYLAMLYIIVYPVAGAAREAQRSYARENLNAELAHVIATSPQIDTVIAATRHMPLQAWQGTAATLTRYAAAVEPGPRALLGVDRECQSALRLATSGASAEVLIISYVDDCGTFPQPFRSFVERFRYPSWPFLTLRADSVRADLVTDPHTRD